MIFTKKQKKWTIIHWENQILTDIPGDSEQKNIQENILECLERLMTPLILSIDWK